MNGKDGIPFLIIALIFLSIGLALGVNLGYIPIEDMSTMLKTLAMVISFIIAIIFIVLGSKKLLAE